MNTELQTTKTSNRRKIFADKRKQATIFEQNEEGIEEKAEALVPSSGIVVSAEVGEDDLLKINIKGRPSGKMADGRHGDHTTSQILSVHGIRRFGNGTKVSEIDEIRSVRESVFGFISAVAVLNNSRQEVLESSSAASEEVDAKSAELKKPLDALYEGMNRVLDKYNARRYKETELTLLEKAFDGVPEPSGISLQESVLLKKSGGIKAILDANIARNRQSNRHLICETFEDLARLTSTYYYNIPNTAYPVIAGYEASGSEGGNVRSTLQRLDQICEKIEEQRNSTNNYSRPRRGSTIKTLSNIAKESAEVELSDKSSELERLSRKATLSEKEESRIVILQTQTSKLQACTSSGNDTLQYIALKLKDLFHYPEISDSLIAAANGRNNNRDEFYDKTAKHLFLVFNTYLELATDPNDKTRITNLFLQEVINHQTNSDTSQGWLSLQENRTTENQARTHAAQVLTRLDELESLKQENLYTVTEGYRSRASSGAMESMKDQILAPIFEFIRRNFDLEEERLEDLVEQLNGLDLSGKSDEKFKDELIEKVEEFFEEGLEKETIEGLRNFLFQEKSQNRGGR